MSALNKSISRLSGKLDEYKKDAIPMVLGIDSLVPYARQARTRFDEDSLRELADSFKEVGVLEPLLVRPLGSGKYEIIAGERRWRAARIAGLSGVPVLVRPMDDELADKIHLAENIHRENLSTLDVAQRVQQDLAAAKGDLAAVAAKYSKGKPWVSKLAGIAQGGTAMTDLVDEGVTADRAVLAAVASLERKSPEKAKELGAKLRAAPPKSNKRAIAEKFMKDEKSAAPKKGRAVADSKAAAPKTGEPAWRNKVGLERDVQQAMIVVELSPVSQFAAEFKELSKKFGKACLAVSVRHPDNACAIVQFGNTNAHRRVYRADELRLLSVF